MPYLHQVLLIVQFNKFDSVMNKLSPATPPLPQTLVEFISSHCAARPPPIQTTTFSFELQVVAPLLVGTTVVATSHPFLPRRNLSQGETEGASIESGTFVFWWWTDADSSGDAGDADADVMGRRNG